MRVNLDPSTLELLAEFICGDTDSAGPVYRKGWELPKFFKRCHLDCIEHDGTTRKWWVLDRLNEYNDSESMCKVLERLASMHEYQSLQDSKDVYKKALTYLNKLIAIDGFCLVQAQNKFTVQKLDTLHAETLQDINFLSEPTPCFTQQSFPLPLGAILESRWEDAQRCWNAHAYVPSIICMGSLLEGVLLQVVTKHPEAANRSVQAPKERHTNKVQPFPSWTLEELLKVAFSCGWIRKDRLDFSQILRDYRNIVHPWHQMTTKTPPDSKTCAICWEVVKAAVKDLLRYC